MKLKKRYVLLGPVMIFAFFILRRIRSTGLSQVEGWNRNTSRNINDYVSEKLRPHIMPEEFCVDKGLMLVIVNSKPSNFEARNAIRETWGQKRDNVSFFFLLGEIRNNSLLQSKVELESKHFDDIIQERFIDHYNNLTLKSVNMLKLFNSHCSKSYKYLMKIDDDVFLNIDLVMEMLLQRKSATDVLVGKIINDTGPFRETGNKWYVPYEWYPEAKYPDYLCGPTYLMSADVVRKLYHCALETPIFYIEDVYVTGICAKKMGIVPKHDRLFTCHHLDMNFCHNRNLYSLHFRTPEDIRNSYRILKNNECPARIGWRDWLFFFNFI